MQRSVLVSCMGTADGAELGCGERNLGRNRQCSRGEQAGGIKRGITAA